MDSFWEFFWLAASVFLFSAYLIVLFYIIVDLFVDHEVSGLAKAVWVFFLILIPALTALVYLIVCGAGIPGRQMAKFAATREQADSHIRSVVSQSPADQIAAAKALLDTGAINQDEFNSLKAKALA